MDPGRILAIARKSLGQISNDRRTLAFILIVPIVLIIVFGYGFGGEPNHIAISVANSDTGPAGNDLLNHLPSGILDLNAVSNGQAAYDAVHDGRAWAAIVIPPNFTEELLSGNATLAIYVDGTSPSITAAVRGAVESAIQSELSRGGGKTPLSVTTDYVYGSSTTSFIDTLAPGVMALVATFGTTVLSILVLVREKSQGLLERLLASPLLPGEFVAGHGISLAILSIGQTLVVLTAAIVIFQASFAGSIALALAVLLLFALGNIGLGMLISAAAQSEFQAVQLIPFLIFPQLLFSGALFPIDSIPVSFRAISDVLPLTYAADALRSILLRGWGLGSIGWDLLALVVYASITLAGATVLIRRQA